MKVLALASASALAMSVAAVSAATVEYSDSVSLTSTNWTDSLSVSQFDSSLGTLTSVMVTLEGTVEGNASAESLDASATTVQLDLSALITASTTALGSIVSVLPLVSQNVNFTAFDGTIDFGGTSGTGTGLLNDTQSDSGTLFGADMNEFIGGGTVSIDLNASGASNGSGAGNLITQFATSASAVVTVKYSYEENIPPVPLPAGAVLLGTALLGFGALRRKA